MVLDSLYHRTNGSHIFVPAWGWVGSEEFGYFFGIDGAFSSPSGDGLVLHFRVSTVQHHRFSSPLGDGLVPAWQGNIDFNKVFSSPSGDGLVRQNIQRYFVKE